MPRDDCIRGAFALLCSNAMQAYTIKGSCQRKEVPPWTILNCSYFLSVLKP
uniref:Uncharacterized protein n=1 Tax=Siphoviridae sp. ct3o911 TaxID=2827560 RepID=A0A8S5LJY5_9CAUD|nr:MAG TPA: hypothetical protein [Siphoviridae sp. ct3o911]